MRSQANGNNNKKVLMTIGISIIIIVYAMADGILLAAHGQGTSSEIIKNNNNITELSSNKPPIANVSDSDQTVQEGTENVTLDGTKSYDPDGKLTAYSWEQIAGPPVKLNSTMTPSVKFNATCETADSVLKFRLTVTDNNGSTSTFTPVNVKVTYTPSAAICKDAIFSPSLPLSFTTGTSYPFKVNFGTKFSSISKVATISSYDPAHPFVDGDSYFIYNFGGQNTTNTNSTNTTATIPNNTTATTLSIVDPHITNQFLGGNFTSKYISKQGGFTLASLKFCIKGVPTYGSQDKTNLSNNATAPIVATKVAINNQTSTAVYQSTSFDASCNIIPTMTTAKQYAATTTTKSTNKLDTNSILSNGNQSPSLQAGSQFQPSPSYPSTSQYPYYQNPYPYQPSPSYPSTSQYPYYQNPYPYYQNPYPYYQNPYPYPPQYQNQPPIANAGPNQIVNQGAVVTLDGTRSYDPDGGTITSYRWQQIGGSRIVSLTGANTATPTFIAPSVIFDTVLTFQLTVTDSDGGASASSVVNVLVKKSNVVQTPIANAGPNQIVNQGAVVTLDGTRSYDPSGGSIVAYSWVQTAGPPVTLIGPNTATPIFRADVVSGTVLAFSLTVTSSNGLTSNNAAIVYITVT
jgi:PKD domain